MNKEKDASASFFIITEAKERLSLSEKTKKWLAANCAVSLKGKTVVVTGANSGVGFKTAETMLYLGADVVMACRNRRKAEEAKAKLLEDYPGANITLMELDLASFASIDAFVKRLEEQKTDVSVFVNNAGVFHRPGEKTADGFDLVIGTNYLGVYRLTEKLLPYLQSLPHETVYINTVSIIAKVARDVDYGDFYLSKKPKNMSVYARSKICLARYTCALAERLGDGSVRVLMNHPGIALTPLGLNAYGKTVKRLSRVFGGIFNSPEKSSLSVAYIMSHSVPDGSLIGPKKLFGGWGYPKPNRIPRRFKKGADELAAFSEGEMSAARPAEAR